MMPMQYTGHIYADAVNYAMMNRLNAAPSPVTRVQGLWERVRDRAEVVWPLEEMGYGTREFGVRDPEGYMLAFAEEIQP